MRRTKLSLAISSLILFTAVSAQAADKLRLEKVDVTQGPTVKMYLTYVDADGRVITGRQKEDFKLILDAAEQGTAATAVTFDTTGEPINVVVVAEVSTAMQEVIEELKRGIKNLADSIDPKTKSKMGLLAYAADTKRLTEMGAPAETESAANTMAIDSEGVEVHMLDAMRTAIDLLNAAPKTERKLIVLFSDGIDVNMDRRAFQVIGKKAQDAGIVVDTIGYAPFEVARLRNLQELSKQSNGTERVCKNSGEVSTQFANLGDEIKKQYVVSFETAVADKGTKDHTLQSIVSDSTGRSAYSNEVVSKIPLKHPPPPPPGGSKWWIWLLVILGGLGLICLVAWLILRPKEELPEEAPAPAPQAPAPAPSPSAGGAPKTVALDIGAIGGKLPAVGWIVATGGKHANQTFKFKPGRTVIGTGADCDIVIEDQFMSSKHCEVTITSAGNYKLSDLGSTNGIVVNDKKVREHELVDNDLFRLGRTEFKFKSIT